MREGGLIQLCAGRYFQGEGTLTQLGPEALRLGRRALVLADANVWEKARPGIEASLGRHQIAFEPMLFSGHCCPKNYKAAAQAGLAFGADCVIGVGGGRAIDTAKIASDLLGVRCITVPTSAATCACSAWLSVHYTDGGDFVGNYWTSYPPFAALADLKLILGDCPPRYNLAGVVDAMAKYPEIMYNIRYSDQWEKNAFSDTALTLAHSIFRRYIDHEEQLFTALRAGLAEPFIEDCLCAAMQLTGVVSSMACGGKQAAISHTLYSYFCCHQPALAQKFLHGELVGASLIYQLLVNEAPQKEVAELAGFLRAAGMPASLQQLGLDYTPALADKLFGFIQLHMPIATEEEMARLRGWEQALFEGYRE